MRGPINKGRAGCFLPAKMGGLGELRSRLSVASGPKAGN